MFTEFQRFCWSSSYRGGQCVARWAFSRARDTPPLDARGKLPLLTWRRSLWLASPNQCLLSPAKCHKRWRLFAKYTDFQQ